MDVNEWLSVVFRKHSVNQFYVTGTFEAIFKLGFLFAKRSYHIYNLTPSSVTGNSLYYSQVKVIPYHNGSLEFRVQRPLFDLSWPAPLSPARQNSYVKMDYSEKMTGGIFLSDYKVWLHLTLLDLLKENTTYLIVTKYSTMTQNYNKTDNGWQLYNVCIKL